jgi:hypothetical protein
MTGSGSGFDRLASAYRALEFLAFGGDLERARFAYLDRLASSRDILLLGEGDGRCADARTFAPGPGAFDAVATLFFLDCLDAAEAEALVASAGAGLRAGATWLFADFALPPRGAARLRARAWLAVLYAFFRLAAGLRVSALPPSEDILARAGWSRAAFRDFQGGLVRSAVYARAAPTAAPGASA